MTWENLYWFVAGAVLAALPVCVYLVRAGLRARSQAKEMTHG
jgi:hypothetical protein